MSGFNWDKQNRDNKSKYPTFTKKTRDDGKRKSFLVPATEKQVKYMIVLNPNFKREFLETLNKFDLMALISEAIGKRNPRRTLVSGVKAKRLREESFKRKLLDPKELK